MRTGTTVYLNGIGYYFKDNDYLKTFLDTHCDEKVIQKDCHYCENAMCSTQNSPVDCYNDGGYFDHSITNVQEEAENCPFFEYCAVFPKT